MARNTDGRSLPARPLRIFALLLLPSALLSGCRGPLQLTPSDAGTILAEQAIEGRSPAARGAYAVRTLYYGSGTDRHRPEYRDSVTLTTDPVDASKLVDLGRSADERNEYWGFTPEEFPLNGRVWYPDADPGEGPFPLVLVVHGNHNMKDFSDPGYDYLGELLASRGFILASVDENFINGGIRGENDGRGWILLQHLREWRRFQQEEGSPLRGLVDMENIALIGHSRGGEAVAVAAAFNRLDRYPDDASLAFDFGFPIRAVVAIAPVDGQYLPASRRTPVEGVSYLVFHGSHDGDVTSFHGLRQYQRVSLSPGSGDFKAAVYMYRANHGQWNTVWGSHDNGPRSGRILDLRYLIEPEKQRRMAEIYVTAFLESRLKGNDRWLPLFRDHRVAGGWLPETMYVTRFHDASFRPLADFEEDIDVTSGAESGVTLRGDSLATWREDRLELRSRNRASTSASQENQAVWLAWNNRLAGEDTTRHGPAARYTVALPDGMADEWKLDGEASLHLLLAPTERLPGPRDDPGADTADSVAGEGSARGGGRDAGGRAEGADRPGERSAGEEGDDEDGEKPPVDLTVELEDVDGVTAQVALSRYGPVRRPLETHILRRDDLEEDRFSRLWELVLQSYTVPLSDFTAREPELDLSRLIAVRLVFDRVHAGEVVVDDIGFARLDPSFWSARVGDGSFSASPR